MTSTFRDGGSKNQSAYGRRARYDCCCDCGRMVAALGDLWCADHRGVHRSGVELEREAGHRQKVLLYLSRGKLQ